MCLNPQAFDVIPHPHYIWNILANEMSVMHVEAKYHHHGYQFWKTNHSLWN
jgi:hypothetical protein